MSGVQLLEGEDERTGSHSARYTSPWVLEHIIDAAMLAAVMKAWRAAATGLKGSSLLTKSLNRFGLRLAGVTPSDHTWDTERKKELSKKELSSINGCILGTGSSFHPE